MYKRKDFPFRADHVGSLLRPSSLLVLRKRFANNEVSAAELRSAEDAAIREVVALQEAIGLKGVTDGEFRRHTFHTDFIGKLQGVEFKQIFAPGEEGSKNSQAPFVAFVKDKMSLPEGGIEVDNFRFLKSVTKQVAKATIPSPTMMHFRGGRESISAQAYPELESFYEDLANIFRQQIALLGEAGCQFLQLDDTNLAYLCDSKMREGLQARGDDPDQLVLDYTSLINNSLDARPEDMAACIHLCRGNARSAWFASGGYEPIAERLFSTLKVDGYFLEFDDDRSGGFEPLRFVPKGGAKVVLGLVSSKLAKLEDKDQIKRRIEEASKYIALDQLCLSPQCGFASVEEGNLLTHDDQKRKLELVVTVAQEVWG